MTANAKTRPYGAGASDLRKGQTPARAARVGANRNPKRREPILYVYADRICQRESKERELYRAYGAYGTARRNMRQAAAQTERGSRTGDAISGSRGRTTARPAKKPRYKLVMESIVNLFESIEERRNRDVEAAKQNAILRKRLLEHRRGFFLAVFMLAFLAGFAALIYLTFFNIQTVEVENPSGYTEEEISAASGISLGDGLFSFRAKDVSDRVTFACPLLQSVAVSRSVPNRVLLSATADEAVYWVNVYGDKLALSAGLRVLGPYDAAKTGPLTELLLPRITYAVAGRVLSFAEEKNDRLVRDLLSTVADSPLHGRITMADLRNPYDLTMYCDGLYRLRFGGERELAYKLKMAERTIANEAFRAGTPAEIDLTITGEASVQYDHNLSYLPESVEPEEAESAKSAGEGDGTSGF